MIRILVGLTLCLLIFAGGVGVVWAAYATRPEQPADAGAAKPATNVRVAPLQPERLEDLLTLNGRLAPWEEVVISAEVSGTITAQSVEEGDRVAAGDELLRIDTVRYEAELASAEARARAAQREFERQSGLRERGVASEQTRDRAATDVAVTQAALRTARIDLEQSRVYAPFDAVVDTVYVEAAEYAAPGVELIRLVQTDRLKAVVGIPERDVVRFDEGDPVRVTHAAYPDRSFEGALHHIAATAEDASRTFITEVEVPNPNGLLRAGMVIRAQLVRDVFEQAITVPLFAILSFENQHFVAVEEDGVAHLRQVTLGDFHGERVHVTAGVGAGEHLITVGQRDLRDGEAVNVLGSGTP